ncbi:MAG: homoserine kinase [Dermatophilaceae bacterium]|jgi:homoserine kinase|nr:homoserine kinase [Dermatophilaceae bacterium]MBP9918188.1 homoserine kinase [Dermatophilaceae bacterium]
MATLPVGAAVQVRAPASSANLGPGFDSIGLALGVWDELDFIVTEAPGLTIEVSGSGADGVPRDESHLVYRSCVRALRELGCAAPQGLLMRTRNTVPHGRGMGSSATAIVAGVAAAYGLVGWTPDAPAEMPLSIDLAAVNRLASELEGHPDNASATVFGGMTLSWNDDVTDETTTIGLSLHPEVTAVVFVPEATLATHTARALLPERVPLRDAALNSARAGLLVEAATRRPELLVAATRDWLHQEARRPSYAASMALVDALRAAGHAATISGAGPSVLALTTFARVDAVVAPIATGTWRRLQPGIPRHGVVVTPLAH